MLANIIVIIVVVLLIAGIIAYLLKQKKNGAKCVGCPYAKECNNRNCK